jgi:hypothetical protein
MRSIGYVYKSVILAVAAAAAGVAACTVLAPADEVQCNSNGDCSARGPAFSNTICRSNLCVAADAGTSDASAADALVTDAGVPEAEASAPPPTAWGCLNTAAPPSDPTLTVNVQFLVFDPTMGKGDKVGSPDGGGPSQLTLVPPTYDPVAGVLVEECDALDPTCSNPMLEDTTNDQGIANLAANGAFSGYFLMLGPNSHPAYPSLQYPGRFVQGEPNLYFGMAPLYIAEAQDLGVLVGLPKADPPDSSVSGQLFFQAFDCEDRHAPNVVFTVSPPGGAAWYLSDGLPSATATQTDAKGTGGVLNYPAASVDAGETFGTVEISTVYEGDGGAGAPSPGQQLVTNTVIVRPGHATFVFLRPRVR